MWKLATIVIVGLAASADASSRRRRRAPTPAPPTAPPPTTYGHTVRTLGCSTPTAADFTIPNFALNPALPPSKTLQLYFGTLGTLIPSLGQVETPFVGRITNLIDTMLWNCVAAYHPTYLDGITMARPLAAVSDTSKHTTAARQLCGIHAITTALDELLPHVEGPWLAGFVAQVVGISAGDVGLPQELWLDGGFTGSCAPTDGTCIQALLACNGNDPRVVGAAVAQGVLAYARDDGWNADGQLTKGGVPCTANCRPYQDSSNYDTTKFDNCQRRGAPRNRNCWQELLEDNGKGFYWRQEHVSPHIGTEAKPRTMTRASLNARVSPDPNYDYPAEVDGLLANLANNLDSNKKASIEFFDDKLAVAISIFNAIGVKYGPGAEYERYTWFAIGYTGAEHDTILLSWKEKTRWNRIRPTTMVQRLKANDDITTYAGPYQGTGTIKGRDFQPYIRVMPHAEYPSGSGCICQGVEEFVSGALEHLFADTTALPITTTRLAGSSRVEPGATPSADTVLSWPTITALKLDCGQTRLDGGMHFVASVTNAYSTCSGVGTGALTWAKQLIGNAPIPSFGHDFPPPPP